MRFVRRVRSDLHHISRFRPRNGVRGESNNTLYNDVDDFNGFNGSARDVLGATLSEGYQGYNIAIAVYYEDFNGGVMQGTLSTNITHYKRIEVTVTDRQGNQYPFAVIRGNY